MADRPYTFYSLNLLGWQEGKQNYPSPLNDNTTTFVFQKDEDSNRLFLLVEFKDITQIYSKIEVYKYDAQHSAYLYTGKNHIVTSEIRNAINEIFDETSTRSITSKIYFDAKDFCFQIERYKSSQAYISYNQMVRDFEQAMILRETYKEAGDIESLTKLDQIIFGVLLTYVLPIEKEGDDYYIDEIAPIDHISINYEANPSESSHIKVSAKISSDILNLDDTFVWKYQLSETDPKIDIYHYDCTTWQQLAIEAGDSITSKDIDVTGKETFYLTIVACLNNERSLAEAVGTVKLQNLSW